MNAPPKPAAVELPEQLNAQIRAFEARLRKFETLYTVCGALAGLAAAFGLLFLSDRLWDTPLALRLVFSVGGMVAAGGFTLFWMRRWGWSHRSRRDLAVLIQKRHRRLGDRLQGVVELSENPSDSFSPALVRAAIRQVGEEAGRFDFTEAVETKRPRRWLAAAAALAVAVGLPFALFPSAGKNALQRWLNPFRPVERFTFVKLEDLPARFVVAHGEPFEIACRVHLDSESLPDSAFARFPDQPRVSAEVKNREALFKLPGQTAAASLTIRIGDVTREVEIVPTHRPELVGLRARIALPDYLKRDASEQDVHSQTLTVVEGSKVRIEAEVSRELATATWTGGGDVAVNVQGRRVATPDLPADTAGEVAFTWMDADKLTAATPVSLTLETIPDEAPRVEGRGAPRNVAILEDEVARIPLSASDDFGLRSFRLNWRAEHQATRETPPKEVAARAVILGQGGPAVTELKGDFVFSPIGEQVPEGSTVFVKAAVADYKPGRAVSESPEFRIHVLNRLDHAKMIQERMEALMAQIEEAARAEEDLMQENQSLALNNDAKLADAANAERLKANAQAEARNAEKVKSLAETAKDIMKDALRNKDIAESTVNNLNKMSDALKQTASEAMSKAQQSLQSASNSPQDRQQKTSDAAEQEKKAVDELRKLEQKMNQNIENMMAMSFVNRLRRAASEQDAVSTGLRNMIVDVIGLETNGLNEVQTRNVDALGTRHGANRKHAGYVQDDLSGFYNRTRKEVYNVIHEGMVKEKMTERLDGLTGSIRANVTARSAQGTGYWKGKFTEWADLLEEEANKNQEESESEGEPQEVDMETLIALMRARVKEEALREQTRAAEEARTAAAPTYAPMARKLAESQFELANDMDRLEKKVKNEKLKPLITKVGGEMMNAGTMLNQPDTGSETVAVQTEIIELLADLMKQCKNCKSKASMMAAMGMGMNPGQNAGHADSNMDAPGDGGTGQGVASGDRDTEKASGVNPADFPEEFREVLESYYQGMEAP
jgi:hypothetical protein